MTPPGTNPYAPPLASLAIDTETALESPHASKGLRFLNYFIDYAGVYLAALAFGLLIGFAGVTWDPGLAGSLLFSYSLGFLYHTANEAFGGRGISKLITGTRAEMRDGQPLTLRALLLRSLCRMIPFEPFSFLGSSPGGWHDSLSGTRVVNVRVPKVPGRKNFQTPRQRDSHTDPY